MRFHASRRFPPSIGRFSIYKGMKHTAYDSVNSIVKVDSAHGRLGVPRGMQGGLVAAVGDVSTCTEWMAKAIEKEREYTREAVEKGREYTREAVEKGEGVCPRSGQEGGGSIPEAHGDGVKEDALDTNTM